MKYNNIREEELKNKVANDWFSVYDATEILWNIDFTVYPKQDSLFWRNVLLWAEAKTGDYDIITMFVQLILTIGKARTFDKTLPPTFLWSFDFKKFAFIPYDYVQDIFYINDFNWNVTPSNHSTKEFWLIRERIEKHMKKNVYIFNYMEQEKDLKNFIKNNVAKSSSSNKIKIDKNNFIPIYLRWFEVIKPIIDINWDDLKAANISDNDFFLADLFVDDKGTQRIDDDSSIRDNLFVVFENQWYKIAKEYLHTMFDSTIGIRDKDVYQWFWKSYKRPPIKQFRDYIIERRDLLVPQDIRERKGAYFTPKMRVELSQKYITDYLGENWQDEYYIWDCAAGTWNLLAGLRNKYNIYASTLDQADVNVMHERIDHGANLLDNHVFQFDFLNDDFTKLPQSLQDIIADPEKCKKLIIYINPPYAEATSSKTVTWTWKNKTGVATKSITNKKFQSIIWSATNEIFALFMARIYDEIPNCILGQFSTLKYVNGSNFKKFKDFFLAEYKSGFIVPASTFDNVTWKFPIWFTIWNTSNKIKIEKIEAEVFNIKWEYIWNKNFYWNLPKSINKWIKLFDDKTKTWLWFMQNPSPDFQNNKFLDYTINIWTRHVNYYSLKRNNILQWMIYFAVRFCIDSSWLNDRDQFLFPNENWKIDEEFQNNCLAFALFHSQNHITVKDWTNHWIPFSEEEVDAGERFKSHFMKDFIDWKLKVEENSKLELLDDEKELNLYNGEARNFSKEAKDVFDAGRELWKYYHSQDDIDVNASFYDIRAYFQGRNASGRMNSKSSDVKYTELIWILRNNLGILAEVIQPKVYEYEFLKV